MKRYLALACAALLLLGLAGCGNKKPNQTGTPSAGSTGTQSKPTTNPTDSSQPTQPGDSNFRPELNFVDTWVATCNESMSLRTEADLSAPAIADIPAGAELKLLAWEGKFAQVSYGTQTGYVLANYIKPADSNFMYEAVDIVELTDTYSYRQMIVDLELFSETYTDLVEVEVIGRSELGRDIPVIRVGDPEAEHHVLVQGAIHGREHMTAWLLMAMLDYWLDRDLMSYGDVCYHIIPMSNPDGVEIAQGDTLPEELKSIYESDLKNGYTTDPEEIYVKNWKANGLGVDINRNFSAGWELIDDRTGPSSEKYKGTASFCTAEAKALRNYTMRYEFGVTISYHAMGSVIYHEYGDKQPVNSLSTSLGEAVAEVTGYIMQPSTMVDGAGYKDWAINTMKIPSLTIEIGSQNAPLAERELYSIFVRNCYVLPCIAQWLQA